MISEKTTIEAIQKGAYFLKNGGVVAYPTDTVYGLGANLEDIEAIKRIYMVKNRSIDQPLPLLIADISWLQKYAINISHTAMKLAEAFFPGAVTLVMTKSKYVPDIITGGKETVALRVPNHPVTLSLIKAVGSAITGTSANNSGMPSALTANEVELQIGIKIDYIVDGGECPGGIESTIIDVTGSVPEILREGAVSREEITKFCEFKS